MEFLTTIAGIVEKVREAIPAFTKDYDVLKKTVEKIRESTFQLGPKEQENLKKIYNTIYAVEEVHVKSKMLVGSILSFTEATLETYMNSKHKSAVGGASKISWQNLSAIVKKFCLNLKNLLRRLLKLNSQLMKSLESSSKV